MPQSVGEPGRPYAKLPVHAAPPEAAGSCTIKMCCCLSSALWLPVQDRACRLVLCLAGTPTCAPALLEAQAPQELLRLAAAPGPAQLLAWAAAGQLARTSEAGAAALQEAGAVEVGLPGHMQGSFP